MTTSPGNTPESLDPYAGDNVHIIQFIQLSRIYDVLMAQLTETNPAVARELLKTHANGHIVTPSPFFDGRFLSDEVVYEEEDDNSDDA